MLSIVLLLALATTGSVTSDLGALEIQTVPGAEVLWEGILLGTTDAEGSLLIERIPSGSYAVALRKGGFQDRAVKVEVEAGGTTRLNLVLVKLSPPKPRSDSAVRREPPPRRPEPLPTPVEEPAPEPPRASVAEPSPEEKTPAALETVVDQPPPVAKAGEETEAANQRGGFPVGPFLIVAMALAGGLGLFLARSRPPALPLQHTGPRLAPPDPEVISQTEDDTGFIETLRQQEQDLDDSEPSARQREPEIIDAEFIELWETHEE